MSNYTIKDENYFYGAIPINIEVSEKEKKAILEEFPVPKVPIGEEGLFDLTDKNGKINDTLMLVSKHEIKPTAKGGTYLELTFGYIKAKMWDNQVTSQKILPLLETHSVFSVDAEIQAINGVENQEDARIIVFKVNDDIEKYLEYRKVQVDVIWWEYDGLKVSNSAIIEEDDKSYILRNRLGITEKIYIKVLRQNEVYSIVENYSDDELLEMGYTEDEIKKRNQIKLYDKIVVQDKNKK